jgi:hypothetical protein
VIDRKEGENMDTQTQDSMKEAIFEIEETLNKAMALTRSISKLAEEPEDYQIKSDLGQMAEIATGLIQTAYEKIDALQRV